MKPVLQTMICRQGRVLPADPGLCPPSLGAVLIRERAQLMGVLITLARTPHMLCMHRAQRVTETKAFAHFPRCRK